jgi:transposase-like protein
MMLERGVEVSYKPIRRWAVKFDPLITQVLGQLQSRSGDVSHL